MHAESLAGGSLAERSLTRKTKKGTKRTLSATSYLYAITYREAEDSSLGAWGVRVLLEDEDELACGLN
jgi:hypothetical protein